MRGADDYRKRALEALEALHLREYEYDAWVFEKWAKRCESPIEYLLAGQLYAAEVFNIRFGAAGIPEVSKEDDWAKEDPARFHEGIRCEVWPQAQLDKYRVDFLIIAGPRLSNKELVYVAVECDGHEFHERTKEQASRDRARDRALQSMGSQIFRFTGSEIYRDAGKCVSEIVNFLEEKIFDDEAFLRLRHGERQK